MKFCIYIVLEVHVYSESKWFQETFNLAGNCNMFAWQKRIEDIVWMKIKYPGSGIKPFCDYFSWCTNPERYSSSEKLKNTFPCTSDFTFLRTKTF